MFTLHIIPRSEGVGGADMWGLFLGGFPEWRAWPFILFGALGIAGMLVQSYLLGIAFLSMAVLSFWVLKPDMSNPVSKEGDNRKDRL